MSMKDFFPLYQSPNRSRQHHVNLLLLSNEETSHYALIRSLSKLVAHRSKHAHMTYVCEYCLHPFWREDALEKHLINCRIHKPQSLVMPKQSSMKFVNHHKQFDVGFCIYYDFESFLVESTDINVKNEHVLSGFAMYRTSK